MPQTHAAVVTGKMFIEVCTLIYFPLLHRAGGAVIYAYNQLNSKSSTIATKTPPNIDT